MNTYPRLLVHLAAPRRLLHASAPLRALPLPRTESRRAGPVYIFAGIAAVTVLGGIYCKATDKPLPLEPSRFTPTKLVSSEACQDPNYKTIELQLPNSAHPISPPKPIWSTCIKDHDIQIERPFTPLNLFDGSGQLKYWVKRYEHGEMGRWLSSQPVGQSVEIRGPIQTLDWSREDGQWDHVLMISGGTGITPFVQLVQHLAQDPPRTKRFTLLHSSPTPKALPPPEILAPIVNLSSSPSEPWFTAKLFVDSVEGSSATHLGQDLQVRRIGVKDIRQALIDGRSHASSVESVGKLRTLVLVCGPDSMIRAITGPRTSEQDPGPVHGVLKTLGFDRSNVRKL